MSKKIIYLLSLLMALSLVFASCKKNNPLGAGAGPSTEPEHNEEGVGGNGLYPSFDVIPTTEPITKDIVLQYSGDRGYRNPVGVVMGKGSNYVLIVSELRYNKTTADNDIGVDGATAADIYLTYSDKAGTNGSFTEYGVIGTTDPKVPTTDPAKSHAAPVVFKVSPTKLVVVASSGVGISRVGQLYSERTTKSKIDYCVVELTEAAGETGASIKTTTQWTEVKIDTSKTIADKITELSTSDTKWVDPTGASFAQFGTHSARGYVDGTKLVLPVVVANQGKTGASTEYMGNLILTADSSSLNNWAVASYTTFDRLGTSSVSKQKESRVVGKDSSGNYVYLVVPNGSADKKLTLGVASASGTLNDAPTTMSTFSAWDGSLGYLTLDWYGNQEYAPDSYGSTANGATKRSLLMHVKNHENSPTIYLVEENTVNVVGKANGWSVIDGAGKASSIDVLGDGTVITVAEEYAPNGNRKFDIVFSRYSQVYLNSKIAQ